MYKSKINGRKKTVALSFLAIGIIIRTVFFIVNLRLGYENISFGAFSVLKRIS